MSPPSGGCVHCTHLRGEEERWARKEACGAGRFPLGLRGTGIDNTLAGLLACRAATSAKAACFLLTDVCRLVFAADR